MRNNHGGHRGHSAAVGRNQNLEQEEAEVAESTATELERATKIMGVEVADLVRSVRYGNLPHPPRSVSSVISCSKTFAPSKDLHR